MKKLFLFLFLGISTAAYSQFPGTPTVVIDPTSIEKLKETIELGKKTQETLQEAQNILSKVSSAVSSARQIEKTIKLQKQSYEYASKISSYSFVNPKAASNSINTATEAIININENVADLNKILTSNFFNMSDKERLDMLEDIRHKVFFQNKGLQSIMVTYGID